MDLIDQSNTMTTSLLYGRNKYIYMIVDEFLVQVPVPLNFAQTFPSFNKCVQQLHCFGAKYFILFEAKVPAGTFM